MINDVPQNELIEKVAEKLKGEIHMPSWGPFVKTGNHKQRPPVEEDWWYVRAASILRKVHMLGPIGVSKLRTKYGGKKNRGMRPEKFVKGSGSIIRKILQQLEESKLVKQTEIKKHKGKVLTPKGISILYSTAKALKTTIKPVKVAAPKVEAKAAAPEVKKEAKVEVKTEAKKEEAPKTETKVEVKEATPEVKTNDTKKEEGK